MLRAKHTRRGSVMLLVLFLITGLGIVVSSAYLVGNMAEQARQAKVRATSAENTAASVIQIMTERLAVAAGLRLGNFTAADIDALNANLSSIPLPAGVTLDAAATRYVLAGVQDTARLPHDESPLAVFTHQPRVGYEGTPFLSGMVASRTFEIGLYATTTDVQGTRRSASTALAVSQVPPHQEALYTQGTAEICASNSRRSLIGGVIRADGAVDMQYCTFGMSYVGGVEARDGLNVAPNSGHWVFSPDYGTVNGSVQLSSVSRTTAESNPSTVIEAYRGRIRITPAMGGGVGTSRMQTAEVAGSGECTDFGTACAGKSNFSPSFTVQRTITGGSTGFNITCGIGYNGTDCTADVNAALSYHPWPFASAPPRWRK